MVFFFALLGCLLSRRAWGAKLTTCREDLSNKPFCKRLCGVALFRIRSIRAQVRPISLSLNTGFGSGYVLGLVPLRAYASAAAAAMCSGRGPCAHTPAAGSSIARWAIRRANAIWERLVGRLSN